MPNKTSINIEKGANTTAETVVAALVSIAAAAAAQKLGLVLDAGVQVAIVGALTAIGSGLIRGIRNRMKHSKK
jgi:hypothetical protein